MKTYTIEEYKKHYGPPISDVFIDHHWVYADGWLHHCTCIRDFHTAWNPHAFKNCTNCLGRGYPPIPWNELI